FVTHFRYSYFFYLCSKKLVPSNNLKLKRHLAIINPVHSFSINHNTLECCKKYICSQIS
ncbi:hypothetical protein L9F63_006736, partial [Diploptera punctata]